MSTIVAKCKMYSQRLELALTISQIPSKPHSLKFRLKASSSGR